MDKGEIQQRFEQEGYRITEPRRAVIEAILEMPPHFGVDEVQREVAYIGRATLFRTLGLLTRMNLLCRVLVGNGRFHYRLSGRGHHHHLLCTRCGRVADFGNCDIGELIRELAASTGYEIEGHWLEVYGRCSSCSASQDGGEE